MKTELTLLDGSLYCALPCPFCGSADLTTDTWCMDDGEADAITCRSCEAAALHTVWNQRKGCNHTNPSLDEALTKGRESRYMKKCVCPKCSGYGNFSIPVSGTGEIAIVPCQTCKGKKRVPEGTKKDTFTDEEYFSLARKKVLGRD